MPEFSPLLRVCQLLNDAGAQYLVVGGYACILHGLVRTTKDVEILVEESEPNLQKVIDGLARMEDGAAAELTPRDLLENVVVKIADEVEVDVSRQAWTVTYREAVAGAQAIEVDGVRVPFIGLADLITSKTTYREQDQIDAARLRELAARKGSASE